MSESRNVTVPAWKSLTGLSVRRQHAEALLAAQARLVLGVPVVRRLGRVLGLERVIWGLGHGE